MTAIFLALFLSSFDLTSAGRSLRAADLALITLAVVINLSAYLIRAWRWRYLLSPVRRGLGMYTLTSATFIGYMVTFVVPFRLGEIVRPVLVARRERLSASAAIATIAVERMMDLLTVVTLFVVFLLTGHGARLMAAASGSGGNGAAGFVETGLVAAGVLGAIAIPLMAILVIAPGRVTDLLYRINPGAPGGFLARGIGLVRHFASGLRVLRGGRELVMSLLLSFAMWLVIDLSIFVGVRAIGLEFDYIDIFLLMLPLVAGIAVPTPGGVGPFEFLVQVSLIDFWGVAAGPAAAAAILLHAVTLVPTIFVGFFFMWQGGLGWSEVRGMAAREVAPGVTEGRS